VSVAAVATAGEHEPAVVARLQSLGIDVHVITSRPRAYWPQAVAIRSLHDRRAPRARVESAYAVEPWVEAYDLVYSAAHRVADTK
jgi:hypothetical protein